MEQVSKPKIDISTILINLFGIAFLCYVAWMLYHIGAKLRVIAVYALMMPHFISIWRALRGCGRITKTEQWVFVLIAVILWVIQSFFTGKLRYLV